MQEHFFSVKLLITVVSVSWTNIWKFPCHRNIEISKLDVPDDYDCFCSQHGCFWWFVSKASKRNSIWSDDNTANALTFGIGLQTRQPSTGTLIVFFFMSLPIYLVFSSWNTYTLLGSSQFVFWGAGVWLPCLPFQHPHIHHNFCRMKLTYRTLKF